MKTAIACASGSVKGVFVHGVLDAFRERGLEVDAYAAASSSTIPAAFAAMGCLDYLKGTDYWQMCGDTFLECKDVSLSIKLVVSRLMSVLTQSLFAPSTKRYIVAASHVESAAAAEKTQGEQAKRLGLDQLRSIRTKDSSWADGNLALHLFDTQPTNHSKPLTAENLADALYATTRMLHAWKEPGWIDGMPYVDASYTCACPAVELADMGYDHVIAISPEPGPFHRDLYQSRVIPAEWRGTQITFIQPDIDLKQIGVDYLSADPDGVRKAFVLGREAGFHFLENARRRGGSAQIPSGHHYP